MDIDISKKYTWLFSMIGLFSIITVIYIWSHAGWKGEQVLTISETTHHEILLVFEKEDALIQRDFSDADSSKMQERQERHQRLTAKLLAQLKFNVEPELYARFDSLNQVEPMIPSKLVERLPQEVVKKRTWFWFHGNKRYLEVLFWAIFGVMSSLLFNVTQSLKSNELDTRLIPDHIAKLFYGPVVALVIYFSFDKVSATELINIVPEGFGLVVLSFILGFFSRRSMAVLNKLKKIVVPVSDKKKQPSDSNVLYENNVSTDKDNQASLRELETYLGQHKKELIQKLGVKDISASLGLIDGQSDPVPVIFISVDEGVDVSNMGNTINLGEKSYPVSFITI